MNYSKAKGQNSITAVEAKNRGRTTPLGNEPAWYHNAPKTAADAFDAAEYMSYCAEVEQRIWQQTSASAYAQLENDWAAALNFCPKD
jgi:hypothetical protein